MYLKPITVKEQMEMRHKLILQKTRIILSDADRFIRNLKTLSMKEVERRIRDKENKSPK